METIIILFKTAFALFLLMDPIGNIPVYISVLKEIDQPRQKRIILRELVIALIIIVGFTFVGQGILNLLQISEATVSMAGGLILLMISIRMIFPPEHAQKPADYLGQEPFIVPLAIPLVAGPSVLSAVIVYSNQFENIFILILSIIVAWIVTTAILLSATFLKRILGPRGLSAMERLMGLILVLIASQMFLNGLSGFLKK